MEMMGTLKAIDDKTLQRCYSFLNKDQEENIIKIMEKLVGLLEGQETAPPAKVKWYLEKPGRISSSLTKGNATKLSTGYLKNVLHELFGSIAKGLNIVKEGPNGTLVSSGQEFPKKYKDFLNFYKLLSVMCKYGIAKHDEAKLLDAIKKQEEELVKNREFIEVANARIQNIKDSFGNH
jgi:hypothetical protein